MAECDHHKVRRNASSPLKMPARGTRDRGICCERLQGQDTRGVLKKAPTVCGYLRSHGVEIFHLVTPHLVDDLFQPGEVGFFFFLGLSFSDGSHLDENLVICQG